MSHACLPACLLSTAGHLHCEDMGVTGKGMMGSFYVLCHLPQLTNTYAHLMWRMEPAVLNECTGWWMRTWILLIVCDAFQSSIKDVSGLEITPTLFRDGAMDMQCVCLCICRMVTSCYNSISSESSLLHRVGLLSWTIKRYKSVLVLALFSPHFLYTLVLKGEPVKRFH